MADNVAVKTNAVAKGMREYAAELERQAANLRKYADSLAEEELTDSQKVFAQASADIKQSGQVVQSNQVLEAK